MAPYRASPVRAPSRDRRLLTMNMSSVQPVGDRRMASGACGPSGNGGNMNSAPAMATASASSLCPGSEKSRKAKRPARLVSRYGSVTTGVSPARNGAIWSRTFSTSAASPSRAARRSVFDHATAEM